MSMAAFPQAPRVGELPGHMAPTPQDQPVRALARLGRLLPVPLREPNTLLLAAGYAPICGEGDPSRTPRGTTAREALDRFLAAHMPYPALVMERYSNIVAAMGPRLSRKGRRSVREQQEAPNSAT